jgi:hypothetical protein
MITYSACRKEQGKAKTYNSGYSLVVTHLTTNPPVRCLNRAERTGSLVFNALWSYVSITPTCLVYIAIYILELKGIRADSLNTLFHPVPNKIGCTTQILGLVWRPHTEHYTQITLYLLLRCKRLVNNDS